MNAYVELVKAVGHLDAVVGFEVSIYPTFWSRYSGQLTSDPFCLGEKLDDERASSRIHWSSLSSYFQLQHRPSSGRLSIGSSVFRSRRRVPSKRPFLHSILGPFFTSFLLLLSLTQKNAQPNSSPPADSYEENQNGRSQLEAAKSLADKRPNSWSVSLGMDGRLGME